MATKLFFHTATSDYGTGNNDANLAGTAIGWLARTIDTTQGASVSSAATATVAGPTNGVEFQISSIPVVWYSAPIDADVTISGSVTWNLRALESANNANTAINGRLEVIDGATSAITLIDQTARITELGTSEAAANFAETPAAGVVCKRGDRLRVRVFGDDAGTMGSGFTFTFFYNGATGATGDSWLQLTENLTFAAEPAGTQVFPTDTASAVVGGLPTLISDFTGADEDPLSEGGNWAKLESAENALRRVSNAVARSATAGQSSAYYTRNSYGDIDVYVTMSTVGTADVMLLARVAGEGGASTYDGYAAYVLGSGDTRIRRATNGVFTTIAGSVAQTWVSGDKLGLRCQGSTISLWRYNSGAWSQILSVTDTTYAYGRVGLRTLDSSVRFDDFSVGSGVFSSPPTTREAWTSRGAGVQTDVTNTVAGWTAPIQVTDTAGGTVVDWFTRPLTAFTLGGAVRCNIRALESNIAANVSVRAEIAQVAGDGTSPTVWAANTFATELTASEAAQSFLVSGDDIAISNGQRLRFRLYIDDTPTAAMGASQTVTLFYAGSSGATGDTFLTFTQTLAEFVSAVTYVPRSGFVNHQNPGVL